MLIVLSGKGRSGKDTAAAYLKKTLERDGSYCTLIAYADYLKQILGKCFGLSAEHLYGDLKEAPIEGLPIRTKSGNVTTHCWTTRKLMQYVGTDIFRTIDPNCWIDVVKDIVNLGEYNHYIVTDGRFPNEIDWVLDKGGTHIHVQREAKDFMSGKDHASETSLDNIDIEYRNDQRYILDNNGSLELLQQSVDTIINKELNNGRQKVCTQFYS